MATNGICSEKDVAHVSRKPNDRSWLFCQVDKKMKMIIWI